MCTGFKISEDDEAEAYITNFKVNWSAEDGVDYIALYACRGNVSHHSAKSWYNTLHNGIVAAY